ncbi:type I polyketide synthase [Tolypothrix campylonemoides VB511288]|nr:type I polyketide synthase [Tolypothrix campylonemoides VB511288]
MEHIKKIQFNLQAQENDKKEPIAIIGMGCRFPGGADNPEAFWRLLRDGEDAISEVPPERWDINAYYNPEPNTPGKICTRKGGFVGQVSEFDAEFFGIAPREAVGIDPQQRLLLEVSWEALSNSGLVPEHLAGSQTGVFIGITTDDYCHLSRRREPTELDAYVATGNCHNVAAGRLSYILGLKGPSLAVDTSCSSSLVALHLAMMSLRNFECDLALVGGVNLLLAPDLSIVFSQARMLSRDGYCKTFDAAADGYVRGEGCGVVVLKRMSDAVANKDNILALIRGSAINHDGFSKGLTAPNGLSQQAVIRAALENAKIDPTQVSYVEAHGTGTFLGDPIEVKALGKVFGDRPSNQPLIIGSVKTNFGHLEAAAGIVGLIKVVLALQHEEIPPHLHLKQPNPIIKWDELPIKVPIQRMPWAREKQPRLAGVSSFGFSGTNAHVVLEEAPTTESVQTTVERPLHLLTVSAKTEEALNQFILSYENHLVANPSLKLGDICFSTNTGRSHFQHCLSVVAATTAELQEKLRELRAGKKPGGVYTGIQQTTQPKIAFVFTGQGSQYLNMGRQLYETQPTFCTAIDRCAEILRPHLEVPLQEVLYSVTRDNSLLNQTAYTQPALFAIEYALAQVWKSWGVEPDVVMGHSVGEYVAATVAGIFSLEDGLKLIATRGRLMQQLPATGSMVAVMTSETQLRPLVEPYTDTVAIAAINRPENVVLSGDAAAVSKIVAQLEQAGTKVLPLQVSHAFHSPLMKPMLAEFERVASAINYKFPQIPIVSNVTGKLVSDEMTTADYWVRHVSQPVQFAASMETLHQQGYGVFVEIGPKPILLGMGRQCLPEQGQLWLASLRPTHPDWSQMLESLAQLYVHGAKVDWAGFDKDYTRRSVVLPTYPFQRQRYWMESSSSPQLWLKHNSKPLHPLLGQRLQLANSNDWRFETQLSAAQPAYLQDHKVFSQVVFPGAAYLEMALAAGFERFNSSQLQIEEVFFHKALVLKQTQPQTLQTIISQIDQNTYRFQIYSFEPTENQHQASQWQLHAEGKVRLMPTRVDSGLENLENYLAQCSQQLDIQDYYQQFDKRGINYGSAFQGIQQLWLGSNFVLGRLQLPVELESLASEYFLHPALLDAAFGVAGAASANLEPNSTYIPVELERLTLYRRSSTQLWAIGSIDPSQEESRAQLKLSVTLVTPQGEVVAQVVGLVVKATNAGALLAQPSESIHDWFYEVEWRPQARLEISPLETSAAKNWLIFTDNLGVGQQLAAQLQTLGDICTVVTAGQQYQQLSPTHFTINPEQKEDYSLLLEQIAISTPDIYGVVHCFALQGAQTSTLTSSTALEAESQLGCKTTLMLVQALVKAKSLHKPRLWLVTRGAQLLAPDHPQMSAIAQSSLWGMKKAIALEHPEFRCTCIDLDASATISEQAHALLAEVWSFDLEDQVLLRKDTRYVARLVRSRSLSVRTNQQLQTPSSPFSLIATERGTLENLKLEPTTRRSPRSQEVEIRVRATGLNFLDVVAALGLIPQQVDGSSQQHLIEKYAFGGECAGEIVAVGEDVEGFAVGDAVVALAFGSFSQYVTVRAEYVAHKPTSLSFEEAAALPVNYLTAYYALHHVAKIKAGDLVLIHAAAGGTGMAAVQIAQAAGAEVFATASPPKWEALRLMGVRHIMNSRTTDFAKDVMEVTVGRGVDIVLNSLTSGDFVSKSLSVLSPQGRFVEIAKRGVWDSDQVKAQRPDVSYTIVDLVQISQAQPQLIQSLLTIILNQFKSGLFNAPPLQIFPIARAIDAFRHMQQAKHIGKIVVSQVTGVESGTGLSCHPEGTYLITGGLGALGLLVARWLVERGARNLVLLTRSRPNPQAQTQLQSLEQTGVRVEFVQADVSNYDSLAQAFSHIQQSLPPMRGIIHSAGVLDDATVLQQNWEKFATAMAPKVQGAWHLHQLTQTQPLDFFVLFSSAASLLGSPGQANYSAANAFLDALAHYRSSLGLVGQSIHWGAVSQVGMAARRGTDVLVQKYGMGVISPPQVLEALSLVLAHPTVVEVGVVPIQWSQGLQQWANWSFLADFQQILTATSATESEFLQQLKAATPNRQRNMLMSFVQEQIAKILRIKQAYSIEPRQRLFDLGIDSLMAVELKNLLESQLNCSLSSTLVFDYPTPQVLVDYLMSQILSSDDQLYELEIQEAPDNLDTNAIDLDQLSQDELEALFDKKLADIKTIQGLL